MRVPTYMSSSAAVSLQRSSVITVAIFSSVAILSPKECIRRPFSCEHCGNYGADFEDVTTKHWPVCGFRPVPCPNECGVQPQLPNLEHHVSRDCPLTVVNCDFHYAGCEVQLPRKDMPAHLAENLLAHTTKLVTSMQEKIQALALEKDEHYH